MRVARRILIDDLGEEQSWPSPLLAAQLGAVGADFDVVDFAVRNLGYVEIVEKAGAVRLRFRPLIMSGRAVAALLYYVAQCNPHRAALSWFDKAWRHEMHGDSKALLQRISAILKDSQRTAPEEPFLATRRSLNTCLQPRNNRFAPLLRQWLSGLRNESLQDFLAANGLLDRAIIVARDGATGQYIIRHFGRGIRLYDQSWAPVALGRRVQDQPDPDYGKWIGDVLQAVDESQSARCELVHARVRRLDGKIEPWRYERLIVPWVGADGQRMVVSVTQPNPGPGR